jgi:hypothetical protein
MTKEENLSRAYELKAEVSAWIDRNFNFIPLEVVELTARELAGRELYECIRSRSIEDVISDIEGSSDWDSLVEDARAALDPDLEGLEISDEEIRQWILENKEGEVRDAAQEAGYEDSNYPMWSTLFEFAEGASNDLLEKAGEAGFGIAEGVDPFGPLLFVSGCGYSFYASHWIPLYFKLFSHEAEKWAGVDYSMM